MGIIKKFRITNFKNKVPLISLNNISLSFQKNHLILDNISLDISKGQVLGLLGPNGAGKSSIMNIITGLIKPTFGSINTLPRVVAANRSLHQIGPASQCHNQETRCSNTPQPALSSAQK